MGRLRREEFEVSATTEFDKWSGAHIARATTGRLHLRPSESLVRLFRGRFIPGMERDLRGKSVLDVGCGGGNNLLLYASLGMQISATEATEEICRLVRGRLASMGCEVDARVGRNRRLPFEDDRFDFLAWWNVVHYESDESGIRSAFAEYVRVLKPGGWVVVSTTGPDHLILEGAEQLGPHRYRIEIDDLRRGQVFFYFERTEAVREFLEERLANVLVGRVRSELFSKTADFFSRRE